jgi:hypothetical protein
MYILKVEYRNFATFYHVIFNMLLQFMSWRCHKTLGPVETGDYNMWVCQPK